MRVIILDGDNAVIKRQKLSDIKSSFEREAISQFSLKTTSFEQLLMELRTPSFFSDKRLVIAEDVDEKKIDLGRLEKDEAVTLVLLINKEVSATALNKLKGEVGKIKLELVSFAQPQDKSIFQFLDLIGDKKVQALGEVEKLYGQFGGQYLLTMLIYFLRRMILPGKGGSGFMADKIKRQKSNFSQDALQSYYKLVLETEFLIKTGKVEEKTALLLLVEKMIH